jgi:phosphoribosylanthranilate isomerase
MHTQIYTVQSVTEALALAELGVDIIGITPTTRPLPGRITDEEARDIFAAVGTRAVKAALSVEEDEDEIVRMVGVVKPDILHLCGDITKVDVAMVTRIRARIGDVLIEQAIPMSGPEAVDHARTFAPVSDYLILDSYAPHVGGVGATGATHDWSISRQIVEAVDIPVILAGGLSPDNVAEAIAAVQPWAADSLTHTNKDLGNGNFCKDLAKVEAFVRAAHGE